MGITHSIRWIALAQLARIAAQLVSVAVLARLLPQQAYGLIAMAMTVTNLAFMFRDLGTSPAIVRCPALTDEIKAAAHTINMLAGCLVMLVLLAASIPVAAMFKEPGLAPIIAALAPIFPLSALGLLRLALIERESGFRLLARIEVVSIGCGLATSLGLALAGAGVWSLVGQMLAATLATQVQVAAVSPEPLRLSRTRAGWGELLGTGGNISAFRLLLYLEQNVDSMVIGRWLGAAALATYAMAIKITLFPMQNITGPLSRALLPAFSRQQQDPVRLGALYLKSLTLVAVVTAPLMAGLFILRADVVLLVFGPGWQAMPDVLRWLAPVGFLQALSATTGDVFVALGKTRLLLLLGVVGAVLQVMAYVIGIRWGIEGVACCMLAANLVNLFPCTLCVLRSLAIPYVAAAVALTRPLLACAVMLAGLLWIDHALLPPDLPLAAGIAAKVICGVLLYLSTLALALRQELSALVALMRPGRA